MLRNLYEHVKDELPKKGQRRKKAEAVAEPDQPPREVDDSSNKLRYEEKKTLEKKIRKISNRVKALEHEVEQIEAELAKMDEMLMNPDNISGMQVYEDYENLKTKLDTAMGSWEKQNVMLEKAVGKRK